MGVIPPDTPGVVAPVKAAGVPPPTTTGVLLTAAVAGGAFGFSRGSINVVSPVLVFTSDRKRLRKGQSEICLKPAHHALLSPNPHHTVTQPPGIVEPVSASKVQPYHSRQSAKMTLFNPDPLFYCSTYFFLFHHLDGTVEVNSLP